MRSLRSTISERPPLGKNKNTQHSQKHSNSYKDGKPISITNI